MTYYRPPEHMLGNHIRKTIDGINSLLDAFIARIESAEYTKEHDERLKSLSRKLVDIRFELIDLNRDTI